MKTLKSLLMLCAGLSFCACSSDNEPQFPEGKGMVEVKVVAPQTRAIANNGSTSNTIEIQGDITITLYATFDGVEGTKTATISRSDLDGNGQGVAKFWNVQSPTKVTAKVNEGKNDYSSTSITTLEETLPANIPAYGEVVPQLTNATQSPDLDGDDDNVNANEGDDKKTYQMYTATIQMEIPVARLEVSGITLSSTTYTSLNLAGVYLDNVRENGSLWNDGFGNYNVAATDYKFADNAGTGSIAILSDDVNTELVNATLPTSPKVYAYNFYAAPADTEYSTENAASFNPSFKLYFNTGTSSETVSFPRFAFITSYKDGEQQPMVLKNGHIYQITSATLLDKNIIGDESGNTTYGVEVTVKEAKWTIVPTTGEWAQ